MRWIEHSLEAETALRALDTGDKAALAKALQSGAVRVNAGQALALAADAPGTTTENPFAKLFWKTVEWHATARSSIMLRIWCLTNCVHDTRTPTAWES